MGIPVSFGDVESREFEPLPVGKHPAACTSLEYTAESARSGEPALAWQFTVQGGEYDSRIGFLNTSLQVGDEATGKKDARWATLRVLKALGFSEEEIKAKDWDFEDPETLDEIIGCECVIVIGHEMYEGEKKQRVRRVLSAGGVTTDKVPF